MWFASIWIFSLGLPWTLGADFFLRHLVDGDPASNTLSWRWVAGLHTRGKTYAARAENIARYTEGRFHPQGLNEHLRSRWTSRTSAPRAPCPAPTPRPRATWRSCCTWTTCTPKACRSAAPAWSAIATLQASVPDADPTVAAFDEASLADALARAEAHFGCEAAKLAPGWNDGRLPIVTAWAPVGPSADAFPPRPAASAARGTTPSGPAAPPAISR